MIMALRLPPSLPSPARVQQGASPLAQKIGGEGTKKNPPPPRWGRVGVGVSFAGMLIASFLMLRIGQAAAADLVVVESRGADLKPGQAVDATKPLTLKEGQQVILISPAGKTIKLRGPWDRPPLGDAADTSPDVAAALNALITQKLARSDKVGVVRSGGDGEVVPPEPWLLDVTHVGNRCLPENSPVTFWRPAGGNGATRLVVTPYDRSWQARAEWPAGADRLVVPRTLPLHNRATYIVTVGGKETAITLITIPAAVSNDAMRAGWMIEAGCDPQAQALLRRAQ